jgi:hypothetical protein
MHGVVKKRKKSILAKIAEHFNPNNPTINQGDIDPSIPLTDIRTNNDEIDVIASRRNELRNAKHENADVIVKNGGK